MTHTRFLVSSWRLMLVNIVGRQYRVKAFLALHEIQAQKNCKCDLYVIVIAPHS